MDSCAYFPKWPRSKYSSCAYTLKRWALEFSVLQFGNFFDRFFGFQSLYHKKIKKKVGLVYPKKFGFSVLMSFAVCGFCPISLSVSSFRQISNQVFGFSI